MKNFYRRIFMAQQWEQWENYAWRIRQLFDNEKLDKEGVFNCPITSILNYFKEEDFAVLYQTDSTTHYRFK